MEIAVIIDYCSLISKCNFVGSRINVFSESKRHGTKEQEEGE